MMAAEDLAGRLNGLRLEMMAGEPSDGTVLDRSIPGLLMFRDASRTSPFPSRNPNKLEVSGGERLERKAVEEVIRSFASHGVPGFFFWIDPLPHADFHAQLLQDCGLRPFGGTSYHVLTRPAAPVETPPASLQTGRLLEGTGPFLGCYGDEAARMRYRETMGKEGFDHFAGRFEGRVVSTARLFCHRGLAYFCDGGTEEGFRGRGGQSALIAARINREAELGCSLCVVEILALSATSLNNFKRLGFEHSYERKVFECNAEAAPDN